MCFYIFIRHLRAYLLRTNTSVVFSRPPSTNETLWQMKIPKMTLSAKHQQRKSRFSNGASQLYKISVKFGFMKTLAFLTCPILSNVDNHVCYSDLIHCCPERSLLMISRTIILGFQARILGVFLLGPACLRFFLRWSDARARIARAAS